MGYTPEQTSTLFLAIFFLIVTGFVSTGAIAIWRLVAPRWAARLDAQTAKHTADARLSESLAVTTVTQAVNTAKTNEILEGQGRQIGGLVTTVGQVVNKQVEHDWHFRTIADRLGVKLDRESTVTMQPAVEVGSDGRARNVVVATEVIHSEAKKQP